MKNNFIKLYIVLLIMIFIVGSTFAYFSWKSSDTQKTIITFTVDKEFSCSADGGGNITSQQVGLVPIDILGNLSGMDNSYIKRKIIVNPNIKKSNKTIKMDLWLNINNMDLGLFDSDNFMYALTKGDRNINDNQIISGNFKNKINGSTVNLFLGNEYNKSISDIYYLWIWLDSKETSNSTMNQNFNFTLGGNCYDNLIIMSNKSGSYGYLVPNSGNYKIELWGAGTNDNVAGRGAYTSGDIYLEKNERIYFYVGEEGQTGTIGINSSKTIGYGGRATFNGGGAGGNAGGGDYPYSSYSGGDSGGGATDMRLVSGKWDDNLGLKSRLMVAGGGGGNRFGSDYDNIKGNAGTLNGEDGALYSSLVNYQNDISKRGKGGTQTSKVFGIGGRGSDSGISGYCNGQCGGGGGYFGGTGGENTGGNCHILGGGGGSSFVSGCNGCKAIDINGNITNSNIHYSGKKFNNIIMKAGFESMPGFKDNNYINGNLHDGAFRITYLN